MANTHKTLTSLFSDIADSIRSVTGGTDEIVADEFPSHINGLGKPVPTQWSSAMDAVLAPTLSYTTYPITVKAMCYYDGYWYGVGTDSAGDAYKIYGTTTGTLTITKMASSRAFPVTGITCDGVNVIVVTASGAYSNRITWYQSIENFRSTNTSYTYIANADYSLADICTISGVGSFAVGKPTSSDGSVIFSYTIAETLLSSYAGYSATVPSNLVSCCATTVATIANEDATVVGVSEDGHIIYLLSPSSDFTARYKSHPDLQGAKKIKQLGDYLCVACVKDDGTYLYYIANDPVNNLFTGFKITDEQLTIIGMEYAGGVYTLIGNNSNGEAKVWHTSDLKDHGIYGRTVNLDSGYTARSMAATDGYACILADNGSSVQKALATIS